MEKIIEIPEGYEARIEGNKVVLEPKESEDERIRKHIIDIIKDNAKSKCIPCDAEIAYLERLKEQKPAEWNEEDEEMLRTLISNYKLLCEKYRNQQKDFFTKCSLIKEDIEMIDWLKSLRPQPNQEWGEEDEEMLIGIIERGNSEIPRGECGLTPNQVAWLETRLKSLHPQPHWKPSKEQMEALMFAMAIVGRDKYEQVTNTLFLLHKQLKELK